MAKWDNPKNEEAWDKLYQDCKDYAKKHGYSISGLKTFTGMDGQGFNATLLRNKDKLTFLVNEGCGGDTFDQRLPNVPQFDVVAFVAALKAEIPARHTTYGDIDASFDIFIDALVEEEEERRSWKRRCAKSVCVTLKSGKPNAYLQINVPYTKDMVAAVRAKYGTDLKEIINTRFGEPA